MEVTSIGSVALAAWMTVSPYTPSHFLEMAKNQVGLTEKVVLLRRMVQSFPLDPQTQKAQQDLVTLLSENNRFDEALQVYQQSRVGRKPNTVPDFKLLELLLKTGHFNDVLRETSYMQYPVRDFDRDLKLLEARSQALLAQGNYRGARQAVGRWLVQYSGDGIEGGRFEGDVRSIRYLYQHLQTLERTQGAVGKPLFTSCVPDALLRWSHQRNVPIVFFKLIPAHPVGQLHEPVLPGRYDMDDYFANHVEDMNRGFQYLSGGQFSLSYEGLHTLYVDDGDVDPEAVGGRLLTSRVYVHTISPLYKLAGKAFVVLVDYRAKSQDEAAYMGDGIIHISATKLRDMVMMHEVLHGLGATHQDFNRLERDGYQFDTDDKGLMTFERGELRRLGLEEKNRALLGWPRVSVITLSPQMPMPNTAETVFVWPESTYSPS